jgi:hypothetical protein
MATINNAPYLAPTPAAPQRQYGLFDVAMGPMPFPVPQAVGGGVLYVPDTCEDDVFLYAMNCPPVSGSKTFSVNEAPVSGMPFAVITSYVCGALGYSFEESEQKVRTRMALREQRAVERRLWQGQPGGDSTLGAIPGLFQAATPLAAAGCVTEAVEVLEQALADNGVLGGTIHARPGMASHLSQGHLLLEGSGRVKSTWLGTPVVFGQGYNGTGPAGEAVTGDVEYMYASGRVSVWATDTVVPPPRQTFDRAGNQMMLLAEKVYAVAVECGVWSVAVTRNCTTAG